MGLSNYVPSSRISQAGVCTSSTRPASPYDGQVIYETDTDKTLVWNGSAWVFLSTNSTGDVGLVKVIPTGATNATINSTGNIQITNGASSVTVNNCFSSTYTNYRIIFSRMYTTVGSDVRFQLSGYSGNNYYSAKSNLTTGGGTSNNLINGNLPFWAIGGTDGGDANMFSMDISGPFTTTRTGFTSTGFANGAAFFAGGQVVDLTSSTGFILTISAGTFQGGTSQILIYGYRD